MIFILIYWLCSFTLSIYCAENIPTNMPQERIYSGQMVTLEFEEQANNQTYKSTYKSPIEDAQLFITIKNLIDDIGANLPIPVHNIKNSGTFELLKKLRVILEENQTNTNLNLETKFKDEIVATVTKYTTSFLQDLLLGTNYLDGGKRFLEILKAVFIDAIKTKELPDPLELPSDLRKPIAENLLERLLKSSEVKSNTHTINNLQLISPYVGAENGIACLRNGPNENYVIQYFEEKKSKLVPTEHMFELKQRPFMFGISSDNEYLYTFIDTAYDKPKTNQSFFYYRKTDEWDATTRVLNVPYVGGRKFVVYNATAKEFIIENQTYGSNRCILTYISCKDNTIIKEISIDTDPKNITKPTKDLIQQSSWTYMNGQLIGIPYMESMQSQFRPGKEYLIFNTHNNKFDVHAFDAEDKAEMFFRLQVNRDKTLNPYILYGIHPKNFLPKYQAIIQEKINKIANNKGEWDFLNLRLCHGNTSKITVTSILSNELNKAIRVMNTQYFNTTYDNILYDAWYIYHAEKQTYQFTQLNTHSPILQHVSEKIKEIYPLLTEIQKKPLLEKYAVEHSKLSQAGVLSSSWKPVALLKSLRRNVGAWSKAWSYNISLWTSTRLGRELLLSTAVVLGTIGAGSFIAGRKLYQYRYNR